MKYGHEHGTRRQTRQASRWYDAVAEATLARLEAQWPLDAGAEAPADSDIQEEVPIDPPHAPGRTHQAQAHDAMTHA